MAVDAEIPARAAALSLSGDALLAALREAGPADYSVFSSRPRGAREIEAGLNGEFVVFRKINKRTPLVPPIDWEQDPFENNSWRAQLHTLRFLDCLFVAQRGGDHDEALVVATGVALDWIGAHPPDRRPPAEFAWNDKIVGDRAPYLGYLLRAAGAIGRLDVTAAEMLLGSLIDHAAFLADDDNHTAGSNHGLFQDVGLLLLARYLPFLPEAQGWHDLALERFIRTASEHISPDGAHLEHSPGYHHMVLTAIRKLQRIGEVTTPELDALTDRLEEAGGWFVLPDGEVPPIGDSEPGQAPDSAIAAGRALRGTRLFEHAGYAIHRQDDTYLALSAGHHSHVHKHQDDLSFVLVRDGLTLVTEAGKFGYGEWRPGRRHARSAYAHNVVVVDGEDKLWRRDFAYGSGARAVGAGEGWIAMWADNPAVAAACGVTHDRVLLFDAATGLVVVDLLGSEDGAPHEYERLLHLGPELHAEPDAVAPHVTAEGFEGRLWMGGEAPRLLRGQDSPPRGWVFPGYHDWLPTWVAIDHHHAASTELAMTLSFSGEVITAAVEQRLPRSLVLRLARGAAADLLSVRRRGREVVVERLTPR